MVGSGDLNDIKTFGLYTVSYGVLNKPSVFSDVPCYMSVEDYIISGQHVIKQVVSRAGYTSYTRFFTDNAWTNWKAVYDENILTNSDLLSPLANALGVNTNFRIVHQNYENATWASDFTTWANSAPTGCVYIGILNCGWVSFYIGYKYSPVDGCFFSIRGDGSFGWQRIGHFASTGFVADIAG